MSLKVVSRGSHKQFLNGENIVNKHYDLSLDSDRGQVDALITDNNKHYKFHDSLEHFLRKISSNKSSLVNLLENEKKYSTLSNPLTQSHITQNAKPNRKGISLRKGLRPKKKISLRKGLKPKKGIGTRKAIKLR